MTTISKNDCGAQEAEETQKILRMAGLDLEIEPVPCRAPQSKNGTAPTPAAAVGSPPPPPAAPPPPPPSAPAVVVAARRQLSDEHRQRHGYTSGLTDQTIDALRWWTAEDRDTCLSVCNRARRSPHSRLLAPALVLPHFTLDGSVDYSYLRPREPIPFKDGKTGRLRLAKYLSPRNGSERPFFMSEPVTPRSDYLDLARPLFPVEGIKKAACLAQLGATAVSAQGVFLFHDIAHRDATDQWRLHLDLAALPLRGRQVVVCFDGNDTTVNPTVILAECFASKMFAEAGAVVRLIRIPFELGGEKCGVDDYLVRFAPGDRTAAWQALADSALPFDPVERARVAHDCGKDSVAELLLDLSWHCEVDVMKRQDAVMRVLTPHPKQWALSRSRYERLMQLSPTEVADELLKNSPRGGDYGSLRSPPSPWGPSALPHPPPWSGQQTRGNTQNGLANLATVANQTGLVGHRGHTGGASTVANPRVKAVEALRALLADGPYESSEARIEMKERGFSSPRTVRRAAKVLGVVYEWRAGHCCYWRLP